MSRLIMCHAALLQLKRVHGQRVAMCTYTTRLEEIDEESCSRRTDIVS